MLWLFYVYSTCRVYNRWQSGFLVVNLLQVSSYLFHVNVIGLITSLAGVTSVMIRMFCDENRCFTCCRNILIAPNDHGIKIYHIYRNHYLHGESFLASITGLKLCSISILCITSLVMNIKINLTYDENSLLCCFPLL